MGGATQNDALLFKNEAAIKKTEASDQWNFYQAKSSKQNLAELGATLTTGEAAERYQSEAKRYSDEKKDIQKKAEELEKAGVEADARSEASMHVHHRWAQAMTLIQVAIALAAIALLTRKKWLQWGVYARRRPAASRWRALRASSHSLPDADVDAARAVRVGARVDLGVVDRRAALAASRACRTGARAVGRAPARSAGRRRGRRAPADRARGRTAAAGSPPSARTSTRAVRTMKRAAFAGRAAEHAARAAEAVVELADSALSRQPATSLAAQQRQQRAALAMRSGRRDAERVEERRHDVDRLDEARVARAARRVGARIGIDDDERHAHDLVVEQLLLAQAAVAQELAVVGGEHDQRVVEPAATRRARRSARPTCASTCATSPMYAGRTWRATSSRAKLSHSSCVR